MPRPLCLVLILVTLLALLAPPCWAGFYDRSPKRPVKDPDLSRALGRFYVGLGVGYDSYQMSEDFNGVVGVDTEVYHVKDTAPGFMMSFFAGYGYFFDNNFYMGGEVFLNNSSADVQNYTNYTFAGEERADKTQLSAGSSLGISLLPGIRINKSVLFYFRTGYIQARLKHIDKDAIDDFPAVNNAKPSWTSGINFGVGLETLVYKVISVRTEYTYSNYNTYTGKYGAKYSARDGQFLLSLIYQFGNL